jgi:HlyD family secretion protein
VADGRAHRRAVVAGAAGGEQVEIVKGLAAGERVIVDPGERLRDGARVRPRQAP